MDVMQEVDKQEGVKILENLVTTIQNNRNYLSEIDGAIGDGDHGINMSKGFTMCKEQFDNDPGDLVHGLNLLSRILMMKIGGSMGPLYGKFFKSIAKTLEDKETINAESFREVLEGTKNAINTLTTAKVGDKTLLDTLIPATEEYIKSIESGDDFTDALIKMKQAALNGKDSTKDMIAKIGRSSRLGNRSKGVIDPGAASCYLILSSMSDTIIELIKQKTN